MSEPVIIKNAKIVNTHWEREIALSHWVLVEGDGWGCGFGGYALIGEACYDWVTQIMEVLEIDDISDKVMRGMIVRVKMNDRIGGKILSIGHPIKDKWFTPNDFFNKYRKVKDAD